MVAEVPPVALIDYTTLDYAEIADRLNDDIRAEIDRAVAVIGTANEREIQRVRAELQYLSELQRAAQRDTYQNASYIQLLAQRTGGE